MDVSDVGEESQPATLRPYDSRLQRRSYSFGYSPLQDTLEEGTHHIPPALDLESATIDNEVVTISRIPQLQVRPSRHSFHPATRPRTTIRTIQLQRHPLEDTASIHVDDDDSDGLIMLDRTRPEAEPEVVQAVEGNRQIEDLARLYGSLGLAVWQAVRDLHGFPLLGSAGELVFRLVQYACCMRDLRPLVCALPSLEELSDLLALPDLLSLQENTLLKVLLDIHESHLLVSLRPFAEAYTRLFTPVALRFYSSRDFDRDQITAIAKALTGRLQLLLKPSRQAYVQFYQLRQLTVARKYAGYSDTMVTL